LQGIEFHYSYIKDIYTPLKGEVLKFNLLKRKDMKSLFKDPLFYNGFFLFVSYTISAPLNILFYKVATFYYSATIFGIAVSIINLMNWIGFFSRFGINLSVRRFFPETKNKNELINTSILVLFLSGIIASVLVFFIASFVIEDYAIIRTNILLFSSLIVMVVLYNLTTIFDALIVSIRKSIFLSIKQILLTLLNTLLIYLLRNFEVKGYIYSFSISIIPVAIGMFISIFFFVKDYKFSFRLNFSILKRIFKFSLANYYLSIISNYKLLVPTILIFMDSPETSAYYSIVMVAVNILYFAFSSFGTSFMIESVHNPDLLKKKLKKTFLLTMGVLIPMTIILVVFGKLLLSIFGQEYSLNSYWLLVFCTLTSFPGVIKTIYMNISYVREKMKGPIIAQTLESIFTLLIFIFLFPYFKLNSYGISWLAVSSSISIFLLIFIIKFVRNEVIKKERISINTHNNNKDII